VTRNHILGYALALVPVAVGIGFTTIGGPVYLAASLVLNARFLLACVAVWRRDEAAALADNYAAEKKAFRVSLSYLFLHFGALLADAGLRAAGVELWPW
jgi:protoheme IX farnesyltransferase